MCSQLSTIKGGFDRVRRIIEFFWCIGTPDGGPEEWDRDVQPAKLNEVKIIAKTRTLNFLCYHPYSNNRHFQQNYAFIIRSIVAFIYN